MDSKNYIDTEYFEDINQHIIHNYQIADFYQDFYNETDDEKFLNKSKSIDLCCKFWDSQYYMLQNIKDIQRVNLCRDKFCFNCQSMLAIKRQGKYAPILDKFRQNYMIAHMIVTVPNCHPNELLPLLDRMYKNFPKLLKYFKSQMNVRGIDFSLYGYAGAVRGLEVTMNQVTGEFHPHFHCMVLLRKDLKFDRCHVNSYSYDHGVLKRKYSDIEILLQKIWYLIMNGKRVSARALDELDEGYDIMLEDSQGYYHECFKYACKGAFDEKKGAFLYKEQTFRVLYEALYCRRMIQGYGLLHNFTDLDGEILENELQEEYARQISEFRAIETPVFRAESLDQVIDSSKNMKCKYFSKSNLKRLILERRKSEQVNI